jgi:hypothetical protein
MPATRSDASKRIDAYIKDAAPFATKICTTLRNIIRTADPDIVEDWKWGPNYSKSGMVCGFGAFKQHVTLTFFRGDAMKDPHSLFNYGAANAHNRSIKFTSADQIDKRILTSYIREAITINAAGAPRVKMAVMIPAELQKAFMRSAKLRSAFVGLTFTARKEIVLGVLSAKRPETRVRRVARALETLRSASAQTTRLP